MRIAFLDYFFRPLNNEKSFPNNVLLLSRACSIGLASANLRRSISDKLFFTFKKDSGPAAASALKVIWHASFLS